MPGKFCGIVDVLPCNCMFNVDSSFSLQILYHCATIRNLCASDLGPAIQLRHVELWQGVSLRCWQNADPAYALF